MSTHTPRISKLIWLCALLLLTACGGRSAAPPPQAGLTVVASTTIVGDVVQQVAGEAATVTVLMPAGADPHSFEPRPQDIAVGAQADVIFLNGLQLEQFLEPLLQSAGGEARIVALSEGLEIEEAHDHEGEAHEEGHDEDEAGHEAHEEGHDPHVWLDPANVVRWVETIEATLSEMDPENAARYQQNAARYQEELRALDAWNREQLAQIPEARRKLVSDHDELSYFARAYGFEQVGAVVEGTSTLEEPSAQALARLQDQMQALGIPALFVGSTVNPAVATSIAADSGAEVYQLYTATLSEPDGPAPTYLEAMRYNVRQIVQALK